MSERVSIEIDQDFSFRPIREGSPHDRGVTMEVPLKLLMDYELAAAVWYDIQGRLEQLYRIQAGLQTFNDPAIPEHALLGEKSGTKASNDPTNQQS